MLYSPRFFFIFFLSFFVSPSLFLSFFYLKFLTISSLGGNGFASKHTFLKPFTDPSHSLTFLSHLHLFSEKRNLTFFFPCTKINLVFTYPSFRLFLVFISHSLSLLLSILLYLSFLYFPSPSPSLNLSIFQAVSNVQLEIFQQHVWPKSFHLIRKVLTILIKLTLKITLCFYNNGKESIKGKFDFRYLEREKNYKNNFTIESNIN